MQPEEVFHLRAGNQNCDPVGETDHDWPRDKLDSCPHAGRAHYNQQDSGHHRAHEQAVHAMCGDNAGNDNNKSPRWAANLSLGPAEGRN